MKKVLVAAVTAAVLLTSVVAEARPHRHRHRDSGGIDTTTLLLLGLGGTSLLAPGLGATAFAGGGVASPLGGILPLLLLQDQLGGSDRGRGHRHRHGPRNPARSGR